VSVTLPLTPPNDGRGWPDLGVGRPQLDLIRHAHLGARSAARCPVVWALCGGADPAYGSGGGDHSNDGEGGNGLLEWSCLGCTDGYHEAEH
jgi:hypothetical protein